MSERSETKRPTPPTNPVAAHIASRWERLGPPRRIAGVDLARGLAVFGMFAAHLIDLPEAFVWTEPATWSAIAAGRSSILFATLAGVSIGLMTGGRDRLRGDAMAVARGRLAVRALAFLVLGFLLILTGIPVFVILPAYAFLFVLAIPLTGLSARSLVVFAAVVALAMPFLQALIDAGDFWQTPDGSDIGLLIGWHYPFLTWIAFVAAGLACARAGMRRRIVQVRMLCAGAVLAVAAYGADALTGVDRAAEAESLWSAVWTARAHSTGLLEVVGSGGFALAVIALCALLCSWRPAMYATLPLRAVGAMPLTAYVGQLVVWAMVASSELGDTGDLSGFRALDPFWPFAVGTLLLCTGWMLLVGRGPLESLIDRVGRLLVPAPDGSRR
ncbi:putative membrane protein YeiB [Microbacterium terrae]|uniref:Heparan-alpha-glucosaminide N-acetyltransferase catalytic domain-containing protein n=1 Tax=Microbacterium terrae TaxID=69369 RepID=A0A0M2H5S3_9MICO|nr:heparan-alpha-glucosaminide N-acetyltransferase domain-containing protein [Microbacterium terrae]KJL39160.1 hypothetical protein RS81_02254 [Microbacterium terrae]MBP1077685.1 putative membrane protein YeiB [Microbacterium terrae]GLJ99852.1 hypothetical protein GCM10017594_30500 [Microbacterium terrae]